MKTRWTLKEPYIIKKIDERYPKAMTQLEDRGFEDSETWSLDSAMCEWLLPRLERYIELADDFLMKDLTEHREVVECIKMHLADMVDGDEYDFDIDTYIDMLAEEGGQERMLRGFETLGKIMLGLWW